MYELPGPSMGTLSCYFAQELYAKTLLVHRAVDCSVCCMNHFGMQCDSLEGPYMRPDCKRPRQLRGSLPCWWRMAQRDGTQAYGTSKCAAEGIRDRFKCQAQFCRGTFAWGENFKDCYWRNKYCHNRDNSQKSVKWRHVVVVRRKFRDLRMFWCDLRKGSYLVQKLVHSGDDNIFPIYLQYL